MKKIYENDIALGNTIEIESDQNVMKEKKFIPLHGICFLIKDYSMNQSMVISWKYFKGQQDVVAQLTDPNKESHYSVDIDSFYGIPITGDNIHIFIYEVGIEVEDYQIAWETNSCFEHNFSECVQKEVDSISKKVCNS